MVTEETRQIHPEKLNITGKVRNKQIGYRPCHWSPQRPRRNSAGLCSEFKQLVTWSVFSTTDPQIEIDVKREKGVKVLDVVEINTICD